MKIVGAVVLITAPGRNYVTLKITTDDGLVGWGDATLTALSWRSRPTCGITCARS